jgi:hypothetical protein
MQEELMFSIYKLLSVKDSLLLLFLVSSTLLLHSAHNHCYPLFVFIRYIKYVMHRCPLPLYYHTGVSMPVTKIKNRSLVSRCAQLAVLIVLAMFTATVSFSAEYTEADKKAYFAALQDAAVATQPEISTHLLAIVPGPERINRQKLFGSDITWEGEPGSSRVLAVAFMSKASYEKYYKENLDSRSSTYILTKSLWVTIAPELKNFFISKRWLGECPPGAKRVKQMLGLHPAYDYEVLLEMWVEPKDLFRPSPDPEITDHEAALATKVSENNWIFPSDSNPFLKLDDSALFKDSQRDPAGVTFRAWFINRAQTIYAVGNPDDPATWGYPWTRLGYTYDWGNPRDHEGASEFVLRIDPEKNNGEAVVTLEQAIYADTPEWDNYFRCRPEHGTRWQ